MNKVYNRFLSEFRNKVEFRKYIDMWFVCSVVGKGLIEIPLTLMRKKRMNRIYDKSLSEF